MQGRTRCAGVEVVAPDSTMWALALPPRTLPQQAELIALTQAKRETATMVAKKPLKVIIPRYGCPHCWSDNGPALISQVTQSFVKILGEDWKLHCAYRPQNSGQVKLAATG